MKTIYLNAKVESDLDWRPQIQLANVSERVTWHLDLGYFDALSKPIDDEAQYRSLRLALDHFIQKIWIPFADKTEGVMVYQGVIRPDMPIEHLIELVELLPDEIPLFVDVTTPTINSLTEKAFLLSSNRFGRIKLKHDAPFNSEGRVGILLPSQPIMLVEIEAFLKDHPGTRLLSEQHLTLEWNELDELHIFHKIEPVIERKIMGFKAAGGKISQF